MSSLFRLLFTPLTLPSPSAIEGKTILITGASAGLGKEAARHAASLGAGTIILGVRSVARGEAAKVDIETSTGCAGKTRLLVWPVDLESFASVQAFAARVKKHVRDEAEGGKGRLDMAIMNAGMASTQFRPSADGWETSLQVNVLSTALLSLHLLPLLLQNAKRAPSGGGPSPAASASASAPAPLPPHLVFVTSDSHMSVQFPERHQARILDALNDAAQWQQSQVAGGPVERYGVTKLLDLLLAEQLALLVPRDAGSGAPLVVINVPTPGFCKSDLLTREKAPLLLRVVQALVARTVVEGSKILLDAATQGVETHGKYLDHEAIAVPGSLATDTALREKLWAEILAVLKDVDPEVPTTF